MVLRPIAALFQEKGTEDSFLYEGGIGNLVLEALEVVDSSSS